MGNTFEHSEKISKKNTDTLFVWLKLSFIRTIRPYETVFVVQVLHYLLCCIYSVHVTVQVNIGFCDVVVHSFHRWLMKTVRSWWFTWILKIKCYYKEKQHKYPDTNDHSYLGAFVPWFVNSRCKTTGFIARVIQYFWDQAHSERTTASQVANERRGLVSVKILLENCLV